MRKRFLLVATATLTFFLLLAVAVPLYAVNFSDDFGKHVDFVPLSRHMISQLHCYDTGTDDCETFDHMGSTFTKEFTLGFLLDGSRHRMQERNLEPLYLCEAKDDSGTMMVTTGTVDDNPKDACRDADYRPKRAGYISPTNELEAAWPLYRCMHPDTHDTLLTDDPAECTSATYNPAELLGYLYAGGPRPLQ